MQLIIASCITTALYAQEPDIIIDTNIRTVQLYQQGNQLSYPVLNINSKQKLELHFDDLSAVYKNYYYTIELRNMDWSKTIYNSFEYYRGYNNVRISQYRNSSVAKVKYIHYQINLPENNAFPLKTGNYIVKVYKDADTSKLAFTKRFLVVDNKISFGVNFLQPYSNTIATTHQKMIVNIAAGGFTINDPIQQLRFVIIPNYSFTEARLLKQPTFIRQNTYEYSTEPDIVFDAGNEWRYVDLRSFRFQSDRILSVDYNTTPIKIAVLPSGNRQGSRYVNYVDINGLYSSEVVDFINPLWQSDYGNILFTYRPSNSRQLSNGEVYLYGALTDYKIIDKYKMTYNENTGVYENTQLLKQGFYNYRYVVVKNGVLETSTTEGSFNNTENSYTLIAYYKSFISRHEEIIGYQNINTASYNLFRNDLLPRYNPINR
jgi:hypothetical protein